MAKQVNKNSDLGTLKNKSRNVFTPSQTDNSGATTIVDEIEKQGKEVSKTILNHNTAILNAISGSFTQIIDLISDNILETLNNVESSTFGIYNFLSDAMDEKHILGASIPKDYFETVKSSIYQVGQAFNIVNNKSYAGQHIAHLINIESGVYALAAAFWGWDNAKKGKEIDANIKTVNKDMFGPILDVAKMQQELMNKSKSESSSSVKQEQTGQVQNPSAAEKGIGMQLDSILSGVNDISSALNGLGSEQLKLSIITGKDDIALEAEMSNGNKVNIPSTKDARNLINEAMTTINELMRFAEDDSEKIISGSSRQKKVKKAFNSYKSSIKYIITSINDIYEEVGSKIKDNNAMSENVSTMLKTFSDSMNLITKFSDDNTNDLLDAFKNINIVLGSPTNIQKKTNWPMTMYGITKKIIDFTDWISEAVSSKVNSVQSAKAGLNSISSVFYNFTDISRALNLKTLLSLYIKLESLSKLIMPSINEINSMLEKSEGFYFQYFAEETQPQLIKLFDALNIASGHISIKNTTKLGFGVTSYGVLASRLIKMASDIENQLKDVDETELDKIVGRNGKLVKIGKLGRSINDINSAFKKAVVTGMSAKLGTKLSRSVMSDIFEIIIVLSSNEFNEQLKKVVDSKDGTIINIKNLSDILYDTLKVGGKLSKYALHAKLGYKLSLGAIKAFNKLLIEINDPKHRNTRNTKTALGNIECMELVSEELVKLNKNGSKLTGNAITAMVGFMLAKASVTQLNKLITLISAANEDALIKAMDNIQGMNDILTEMLKVTKIGAKLAVVSLPALIGFTLAHLVVKSGIKPLLVSIYKLFEKTDAKEYMFELHSLASISMSLLKICFAGSMLILFAPLAIIGFKLAFTVIQSGLTSVLNAINKIVGGRAGKEKIEDIKQIEKVVKSLKDMCVAGSMLILFAPLAITGFMLLVPAVMVLAGVLALVRFVVGDKDSGAIGTARDLGMLILTLAGVMVIGGLMGGVVQKMLSNIIIFTLTLSFFIFSIVSAISIATVFGGGLRHLEKAAKEIQRIVIMSAMIMLIGGLIVMLQPKLIFYSFVFTYLLSLFLLTTVGIISLAARLMKGCVKDLVFIMAFEIVVTTCLLVPAYIMMQNPGLTGFIFLYLLAATVLVGGLVSIAWLIGKKSDTFIKAVPIMYSIAAMSVALGLTMLAIAEATKIAEEAGGIDKLALTAASGLAVVAVIAGGAFVLGKFGDKSKLALGAAVIAATELLALGMAGVICALAYVTTKVNESGGFGPLWATIGSGFGLLTAMAVAAGGLGLLATAGGGLGLVVLTLGGTVIAALEGLAYGMAKTLIALSEASKVSINSKNLLNLISSMGDFVNAMFGTFGNPIMLIKIPSTCAAVTTLGIAISKIAEGVASASNMHYTKYENGKKVGEFNLSNEDFQRAAHNTKTVVSVLGQAIIDIYKENPEIFTTGNIVGDILGTETKFEKVCGSVSKLGKVISKIANSVADMANLHFTKYDNGKKVGEFNLGTGDFKTAAENTKTVVKTLGQAIMDAYNSNPEIFTTQGSGGNFITDTLGAVAGFFGADTKFGKVAKSMMILGNLISSLSRGISDMANLTVTEYDKNGNEKKRNINESDFVMAAFNTDMIITWLANTIIKVYESHPDLFTSGSGLTDALGFNPKFKNIIDTVSGLGSLMSNIAGGIQAMANNVMPVYGKNGEIIRKDPIKPQWYNQAATTVSNVITCMGSAIMSVYEEHKDWFAAKGWSLADTSSNNAFTDVMKSCMVMAEMVSKYVEIVQQYATGKVDIYGPDGKVIGSMPINNGIYNKAATNVSTCISTLASSILNTYNSNKTLFNEDTFEPLMDNLTSLSELLGKYSNKVKEFANLTYDVYDSNGKIIGKKHIGENEFKEAGNAVKSIITTLVEGVYDAAFSNKNGKDFSKLFADTNLDPNKKNSGETWFGRIINSFLSVSPLVSSMAKAVKEYATLQVPEYDPVTGVATGRMVRMTDKHFEEAGKSVSKIITTLVGEIGKVWENENNKKLFTNASSWGSGQKDNSNPFYIISKALNAAAKMVNDAAIATKNVLSIPGFENQQDIQTKLDTRIPIMTTALIQAVIDAYNNGITGNKNMFDDALSDNSPFKKVAVAMQSAYDVVDKSSKVYDNVSKMDMSKLEQVTGTENDISSNKIYRMIKGLAQPIIDIYTSAESTGPNGQKLSYSKLFYKPLGSDSYFTRIRQGIDAVAKMMSNVKNAYDTISSIDYNINDVSSKINEAILGLVKPIGTAYTQNQKAFDDAAPISGVIGKVLSAVNPLTFLGKIFLDQQKPADTPAMRVIQALSAVAGTIGTVAKAYESIQNIQFDKEKSKTKMTNMITGLVEVFKDNQIDFSDAEDKADDMKDFVETMSQVLFGDKEDNEFNGILTVYEKLQTMKIGSQFMAVNMGKILSRMVEGIVSAVSVPINIDLTLVDDSFNKMKRAIEILISIYKMPAEMLKPVMSLSNATDIDTLITNLSSTIISIPDKLSRLMDETGPLSDTNKMNRLMGSAWNLKRAVANLAGAVSLIPINRDIDYFIPYISKLNKELESIPNLQNFVIETDNLVRFNSSVNSLQVRNVEVLTKLFIEFNKFSSKFGNLDKFTQVLATKMAQCLTYLADQIRDSAKTINKSEEIQKKRQEQIQKTIAEFKKLADQGLEVTVKAAETETSSSGSYSFGDSGSTESNTTIQTLGTGSTSSRNNTLQKIAIDVNQIAKHYSRG